MVTMSDRRNNNNDAKKRRADDGGSVVAAAAAAVETPSSKDDKLMSALHQLLDQNSTQMAMIKNMQGDITSMKGEITQLREKCNGMEKIMLSRFDVVDNKQKYHRVLLQNQKWKYSAPRPSQQYWDSLDEDGDQDDAAEEFLEQIKEGTELMRYGNGRYYILVCPNISVPYNQEFLPHWEEFADALEQHEYCLKCLPDDGIESVLRICNVELPDNVLRSLSNALKSTHFRQFALQNNNFGQGGIDFALKYLQNNRILEEFCFNDNPIENMKDIKQLCRIIKEHPSIKYLTVRGCEGIDGYEMLQRIMAAGKYNLKTVDLGNNDISTGGDTFIPDFLASNPILENLMLTGNYIDNNDAMAIASALKHNTKLRFLDIRHNIIKKSGWKALRKVEFDDTSLNAAFDSNHTCYICYPHDLRFRRMSDFPNHNPTYVGQKKIYSILSSRNRKYSNVEHYEDVPVELLPDMLVSIQKYANYHVPDRAPDQADNDVIPVSIVFEILQRWDKSLATFEALSS